MPLESEEIMQRGLGAVGHGRVVCGLTQIDHPAQPNLSIAPKHIGAYRETMATICCYGVLKIGDDKWFYIFSKPFRSCLV